MYLFIYMHIQFRTSDILTCRYRTAASRSIPCNDTRCATRIDIYIHIYIYIYIYMYI